MFISLYLDSEDKVFYVLDTCDGTVERWENSKLKSALRHTSIEIVGFNKMGDISYPKKPSKQLSVGERLVVSVHSDMTLNCESYVEIKYVERTREFPAGRVNTERIEGIGERTDLSRYHFGCWGGRYSYVELASEDASPNFDEERFYQWSAKNPLKFGDRLPYSLPFDLDGSALLFGDFLCKIAKNGYRDWR